MSTDRKEIKKDKIIVYEKPTCGTCRAVMGALKENGADFEPINYYEQPLTKTGLKELIRKLGMNPRQLLRTKEPVYKELGLDRKEHSEGELVGLMIRYPDLMQRPIVVRGNKVILARPVEKLKEIL